jgi:hypothetical protein
MLQNHSPRHNNFLSRQPTRHFVAAGVSCTSTMVKTHIIIDIDTEANDTHAAGTLHPPMINFVDALLYTAFPAPSFFR